MWQYATVFFPFVGVIWHRIIDTGNGHPVCSPATQGSRVLLIRSLARCRRVPDGLDGRLREASAGVGVPTLKEGGLPFVFDSPLGLAGSEVGAEDPRRLQHGARASGRACGLREARGGAELYYMDNAACTRFVQGFMISERKAPTNIGLAKKQGAGSFRIAPNAVTRPDVIAAPWTAKPVRCYVRTDCKGSRNRSERASAGKPDGGGAP